MENDRDCLRLSRSSLGTGHRSTISIAPRIVTARWTVAAVNPVHNSAWPPATAPTDAIPPDAIAGLTATTLFVPDDTDATIEVRHAVTDDVVTTIPSLKVKADAVIDPVTNLAPTWSFVGPGLWTPWDRPFYYFRVNVTLNGLTRDSEKDYTNHAADVLRLNYWHACISDSIADTPAGGGLTTGAEMAEIAGILQGVPNHNVAQQAFNQNNVPVALWGSILRNTYAYHHASHGAVECRTHPLRFFGLSGGAWNWFIGHTSFVTECPVTSSDAGRSVVNLGQTPFGDAEAGNAGAVPVVPRYLMYLDTCVAGWEPSFANALTNRGTQNVIAFKKYIPDGDAREMARNFYRKWANPHLFDPSKISEVFFETGAPYYGSMRPVLYGAGGGAIQGSDGLSPAAIVGIVLAVVAVAAIGIGLYMLLK